MSSQGPLPYLHFCGTEIANAARTVSYLRNGLANDAQGHWEMGAGDLCGVLYRLNGGSCGTPEVFASPSTDPAPWYDATQAASQSFLGVVLLDMEGYGSTITRDVSPRIQGLGGASFSGQRRGPRTWKFRAALVSADDQGAEYGLRWLTQVLKSSECSTCLTCDLTVRLACPPSNCSDDTIGEWTSYDTALIEGPVEVEKWSPRQDSLQDTMAGCRSFVIVEWTMVSGNPFLYKPSKPCLAPEILGVNAPCNDICDFLFGDPGAPHCCSVTPPANGTLGSVFTLQSVSGMNSVILGAYRTCPTAIAPIGATIKLFQAGAPTTSLVTAPLAPVVNNLYMAAVWSYRSAAVASPNVPTVTGGGGLNWVQVSTATYDTAGFFSRMTLFRALKPSGLTSSTVTVGFAGESQTYAEVRVQQFSNVAITGTDGSGAVVQATSGSGAGTSGGLSLATFGANSNSPFAFWTHYAGEVVTPAAGWTEILDGTTGAETSYKVSQDTSPAASWTTNSSWGGLAVEIKNGTVGDPPLYEMEINNIPAQGTVVVDAAQRRVTVTTPDPITGDLVTSDGQSLIVLGDSGIQWVEARDCDDVTCFCARTAHPCSQGGDTLVSIATQLREG